MYFILTKLDLKFFICQSSDKDLYTEILLVCKKSTGLDLTCILEAEVCNIQATICLPLSFKALQPRSSIYLNLNENETFASVNMILKKIISHLYLFYALG